MWGEQLAVLLACRPRVWVSPLVVTRKGDYLAWTMEQWALTMVLKSKDGTLESWRDEK
jgi:hypothetical protein